MTFDWLNINKVSGGAGATVLSLSANSVNNGEDRTIRFNVVAPDNSIHGTIIVTQLAESLTVVTYENTAIMRNNIILGYGNV